MKKQKKLSKTRVRRIRAQGYTDQSVKEINELAFGNRFAYYLCSVLLIIGVSTANIYMLAIMLIIAALGFSLPNHPFDYIYNYVLAERMGKPQLPKRSDQLKFACTVATVWIATVLFLFVEGYNLAAYIMGSLLISVAVLVATTDYCIPSILYNALVVGKPRRSKRINKRNTI